MHSVLAVLTIAEAANELKVHPDTVRRAIKDGIIKSFKFRGSIRIPVSELEKFLEHTEAKGA